MSNRQSAVEVAQELLAQASDGDDPWLLSYADLVTNLLAFMVVLVSIAGISVHSVEDLPQVFSNKKGKPPLASLEADVQALVDREDLDESVAAEVDREGLVIRLADQILFPSGVAELSHEGQALVTKVAGILKEVPPKYRVMVEGHTDDVPMASAKYPSNWELSSARALEVRRGLVEGGVSPSRLAISAFADTQPPKDMEAAELEERRRKARRVVIRVRG